MKASLSPSPRATGASTRSVAALYGRRSSRSSSMSQPRSSLNPPRMAAITPKGSHFYARRSLMAGRMAQRRLQPLAHGFLASRPVLEEIRPNEQPEDTSMEIIPLRAGFSAELRGVTLADVAAHDAAYQEVRAAFEEYSVLVFRNQDVSNESQLAFSRRFGPPEVTKVGSLG